MNLREWLDTIHIHPKWFSSNYWNSIRLRMEGERASNSKSQRVLKMERKLRAIQEGQRGQSE